MIDVTVIGMDVDVSGGKRRCDSWMMASAIYGILVVGRMIWNDWSENTSWMRMPERPENSFNWSEVNVSWVESFEASAVSSMLSGKKLNGTVLSVRNGI